MGRAVGILLGGVLLCFGLAFSACGPAVLSKPLELTRQAAAPPPAPTSLGVTAGGVALEPNSWTNAADMDFSATLLGPDPSHTTLEVDLRPLAQPFPGTPNVVGQPGEDQLATPKLTAGDQYHWQARVRAGNGQTSSWSIFPGTLGYEPNPPDPPVIQPLLHDGYVAERNVHVSWRSAANPAGTAGFTYSVDQNDQGIPAGAVKTQTTAAQVQVPKDGDWYFHVRSVDNAGNASPVATTLLHVDSAPLKAEALTFDDTAFNPMLGPLAIKAKINKPAQLRVAILPQSGSTPVRSFDLGLVRDGKVQWDGKDGGGQAVPPGAYRIQMTAQDKTERSLEFTASGELLVTNKRIVISLSQERLIAYEGDKPIVSTPVTTGGPELPTPTGTFHVLGKRVGWVFHSPWPKSSPYWYADSPTNYALLYDESGYFIHDAPWRSRFGPGTNAIQGTPGQDGTGTHGCTNVPLAAEVQLLKWSDVGTPVIVQS